MLFLHIWLDFASGLFLSAFLLNSVCISLVYHICHMPFHCIYTDMNTLTLFGRECTNFDALLSTSVTSYPATFPLWSKCSPYQTPSLHIHTITLQL
jgi:hypothetical protein